MSIAHPCPVISRDESSAISATHVIACPKCTARLTFSRSRTPRIDACGFESYTLECVQCGGSLAGIVDPFDDTLLLSEMAA